MTLLFDETVPKNPAYRRHHISRHMLIEAPIPNKIASFVQNLPSYQVTKIKVNGFPSFQISELPIYRVSEFLSFQVSELLSFQVSKFLNIQFSKLPSFKDSKFSSFYGSKLPSYQVLSSNTPFPGRLADRRKKNL